MNATVSAGGSNAYFAAVARNLKPLPKYDDDRIFLTNARAVPARMLAIASIKFQKIIIP
jgi:hypothetical protein